MESYFLGDSCICWKLGNIINKDLNKQVLFLYGELKKSKLMIELNILDVVPSFNAIAIYFDALDSDPYEIQKIVDIFFTKILNDYNNSTLNEFNIVELPVIYDGEDLQRVAKINNISKEMVITLRC